MFRLTAFGAPGKGSFGRGYAGIIPIPGRSYVDDLEKCHGRGRPILVGVFHEFAGRPKLHRAACLVNVPPVPADSLAGAAPVRDVIDRFGWASSHLTQETGGRIRGPRGGQQGPPNRGGKLRWGRRSWQVGSICPIASATARSCGSA
ncbi:hypothetical protein GCM10022233_83800 [Streptomyces shaanxiensis]|uniref:Uncharacterized protein n=1 Tax=Streptomyces shaanxiensis TaxID=653357 RepID=A0ABP7WFE5_9ACTN